MKAFTLFLLLVVSVGYGQNQRTRYFINQNDSINEVGLDYVMQKPDEVYKIILNPKMDSVPQGIANLLNLEVLDFNGNTWMSYVSPEIGYLVKLWSVSLDGCTKIGKIPDAVYDISGLRKLSLAKMNMSSVDDKISKFKSLEELDLSGNPISTLPEGMGSLTKLKELDISGTNITSVPDTIQKIQGLKIVGP